MRRCIALALLAAVCWPAAGQAHGQEQSGDEASKSLALHWLVPTANDAYDHKLVKELLDKFADKEVPAIPAFRNLVAGGYVFMRTPDRVVAVDYKTGKRTWEFPWFESPRGRRDLQIATRTKELRERFWDDAAFASMTVAGNDLFVLDKLDYVAGERPRVMRLLRRPMRTEARTGASNELVAIDIPSQGKIRWIVGGDSGADEPRLAGFFFLSSGAAHGGKLYVVGQKDETVQLVVLDPKDGHLEWSLELAKLEATDPRLASPLRRLAGVLPVVVGKRVIVPMALGQVVAVDLETHKLAWKHEYQSTLETRRRARPEPLPSPGERWLENAALVAGDRVIVTPADSQQLYCLDVETGNVKWQLARGDRLYAAAHRGVCLLVGPHSVSGYDAHDGATLWEGRTVEISEGAVPSGRGVFDGDRYLLPTTFGDLLAIDCRTGKATVVGETKPPLGNLTIHGDSLISQGADYLGKFAR